MLLLPQGWSLRAAGSFEHLGESAENHKEAGAWGQPPAAIGAQLTGREMGTAPHIPRLNFQSSSALS